MNRRKIFIPFLLLAVLLLGCGKETIPEKGDFSVSLPEGYSISNVTDKSCDILRSDGALVGGMVLTEIAPEDMKRDSDSPAIPRYLDSVAGLENMSEYFSWLGEEPDYPTLYMDHYITNSETQEKTTYKRVIFVHDGGVYDMWFDLQVMDKEDVPNFYSIVENQ